MISFGREILDFIPFWTWALILTRFAGVFIALPGIGTEQIPSSFKYWAALALSLALASTGIRAKEPAHFMELALMLSSEFMFGYVIGAIPSFIVAGAAVAGQAVAGTIGLAQANMIDVSLGGSVAVLSRIKALFTTAVFLAIDGHHAVIRAATMTSDTISLGVFRPDALVAEVLLNQLVMSFQMALAIAAPVLITSLITQFVLGLISKFVPQLNIFLITMPLLLLVGLYVVEHTLPSIRDVVVERFEDTGTALEIVLNHQSP